jgi:microcompartment protein CcmK/EutM
MFLAMVKGNVVSTQKDELIKGYKLLIVEPLQVKYQENGGGEYNVTGRAIVAIDRIGAGEGQLVLVSQGSSARLAEGLKNAPIDAAIIGLVDKAMVGGTQMNFDPKKIKG